jgi:hypothetical protein
MVRECLLIGSLAKNHRHHRLFAGEVRHFAGIYMAVGNIMDRGSLVGNKCDLLSNCFSK